MVNTRREPYIHDRMWFGWTRWRWMVIAYVVVCLATTYSFYLVWEHIEDNQRRNDAHCVMLSGIADVWRDEGNTVEQLSIARFIHAECGEHGD